MGVAAINPNYSAAQLDGLDSLSVHAVNRVSRIAIVIPTFNAEAYWERLTNSLRAAGARPQDVLVIDSSSLDKTQELARKSGFRLVSIPQNEFNHGGTRQLACDCLGDVDAFVMMTQDAVLDSEHSLEALCRALDNPRVGAAYGRQIGREEANAIERHSRIFNYPETARLLTLESRDTLGLRAAFLSNSFAIYRKEALDEVGGFPADVIFAEDSYVAAKMLLAGWTISYVADASVIHSHHFRVLQEFRRYFDIGVHHSRERWLLDSFGAASGEGARFIRSEFRYLVRHAPHLIPLAMVRSLSKLVAYRMGGRWQSLPAGLVRKLSSSNSFWKSEGQR